MITHGTYEPGSGVSRAPVSYFFVVPSPEATYDVRDGAVPEGVPGTDNGPSCRAAA